jgi:4-aminobutyrate aminotransferase-like enzyme
LELFCLKLPVFVENGDVPFNPPHGQVLRIKPPMCLTIDDADFLADCLDEALACLPRT